MVNSVVMEGWRTLIVIPGRARARTRNLFQLYRYPGFDASHRPGMTSQATSLLGLAGVLDGFEGRKFDVVEFAVDLLDLADVDVLHDIAGFRIDRDGAARALPLHPLHGFDQPIAVGLAGGLLQRLVNQVNAVIAAHRHETGARVEGLLVGRNEFLVH